MNCAEFEVQLADYLDGALSHADRVTLQTHAASCAQCRQLMEEAEAGFALLSQAAPLEAPPELLTRIAYQAPVGRLRDPFESDTFWSRLFRPLVQPLLRPRMVMGMAMTILSFAMLERCTGIHVQRVQAADLNPIRIWGGVEDRAIRVKDRAVKYYENLRWVYEIEVQLGAFRRQAEAERAEAERAAQQNKGSQAVPQEKKDGSK